MTQYVTVVLDCAHVLEFPDEHPPMIGEELWCKRCEKLRRVEVAPPEWRVRCRRCPYARRCGSARLGAEVVASKHATRKHHPVAIYNGRKLVYVVGLKNTEQDTQLELPMDPPF